MWILLDYHYYQNKIVDFIMCAAYRMPDQFKEVLFNSFEVETISEKDFAIRRFSTFWRITGELKKTDLSVIFENRSIFYSFLIKFI